MLRGGGGEDAGGSDSDVGSGEELERVLGAEEAPAPARKQARRYGVASAGRRVPAARTPAAHTCMACLGAMQVC